MRPWFRKIGLLGCATALVVAPKIADAFCGFYVAGAGAELFNDATVVVLMRDGTRTVLSMQNDYQGPPEDFALVVPVPVVLKSNDVQLVPEALFGRIDRLAAPRLVEYWERDPCEKRREEKKDDDSVEEERVDEPRPRRGVKVEAEFEVGEYDIQILSARDSTGLDLWLREENYNIPSGAEPLLRPYVESGSKFFVAKVDAKKVKFDESGHAMLSPLRFHYDSPDFSLPVRLGLINARGPQDLLIHIIATERYQLANYPNVTIPTNLVVREQTKDNFGQFYVSLFDKTLAENPRAVVTEYAWQAGSCDPCPEEPLSLAELGTLGLAVLPSYKSHFDREGQPKDSDDEEFIADEFVLTRLHARYDAQSLAEDLVFEAASGLEGGRGMPNEDGELDGETTTSADNQFQARYAILHRWTDWNWCLVKKRGQWYTDDDQPRSATNLAFEARDAKLEDFVGAAAHRALGLPGEPQEPLQESCKCTSDPEPAAPTIAALALLGLLHLRRRKARRLPSDSSS